MNKILLTVSDFGKNNAASKPRDDIKKILKKNDDFYIWDLNFNINSKISKAIYLLWTINKKVSAKMNEISPDEIFIQYPIYSKVVMEKLLKVIHSHSHAKIYFIVHDVESLRMYSHDTSFKHEEIDLFNSIDGLIVHNSKMRNWLFESGVKKPMVELGIFDYLNPQPVVQNQEYQKTICFAGNLSKAKFLNKVNFNAVKLFTFGKGLKNMSNKSIVYKGQKTPEELPKFLNYNFGLVWDGDSVDTCAGDYGDYIRYNAPHKISLYLSTGLPVIIWDQAAMAVLLKKYNLGITINSLNELENKLNSLSADDYALMKANAVDFSKKLREGFFISTAVNKLESIAQK